MPVRRRGHILARDERPDRPDRFVEPVEALTGTGAEVEAELAVFELEPGAADAEDRPPARHVIQRGNDLRHERGVAEGVGPDHQPEPHPLRGHGPGRDQRPALVNRLIRLSEDRLHVVPRPEVLVAKPIDSLSGLEQLGPRPRLTPEVDADLELRHGGLPRRVRGGRRLADRLGIRGSDVPQGGRSATTICTSLAQHDTPAACRGRSWRCRGRGARHRGGSPSLDAA